VGYMRAGQILCGCGLNPTGTRRSSGLPFPRRPHPMILERNRIDAQGFECMYLAGLSNAVLVGVLPETKFCPYGGTG